MTRLLLLIQVKANGVSSDKTAHTHSVGSDQTVPSYQSIKVNTNSVSSDKTAHSDQSQYN